MKKVSIHVFGLVFAASMFGSLIFTSCSPSPSNTSNTTKPAANTAAPKAAQTIPPNSPPGAEPPEQSGSATATVKLEEFADLQCGACAAAHTVLNDIKSMYGSRIHFIYRNFPLPMHDKGYDAALAATAAGMQGKFWDMQNLLFSNQKTWASDPAYKQTWKGYAQKIGLDVGKWESDMAGQPAKNRVEADLARGKAVGISSTPTLFINGTAVPFADMKVDSLKTLIDAELQKTTGQNPAANKEAAPAKSENTNK